MIPTVQITGERDTHPETPVRDAYELANGKIDLTKLNVSGHFIRIFDLMNESDRSAYELLYVDLASKAKQGKIIVSNNSRELLTRADGSTGWYKYVEWTEFDTSEILGA